MNTLKRIIKITILTVLAIATSVQYANCQSATPRDRNCFHHRHYNVGGVCLLSSYGFLLEYANSSNDHIAPFDNFDMMELYMHFHNLDEECPQHSADYFRKNQREAEKDLSAAINGYCIARRWAGYIRVLEFHQWLKSNSDWADNIELVKRAPEALRSDGHPLEKAYSQLASYLEQNADPNSEYDYAAIICYPTTSGPHSVFLGYDHDYFLRDINFYNRFADISCSFDFTYGPQAKIQEYVIFKIKRQTYGQKEWTAYNPTAFQASRKADGDFWVLDNPIPLKHLRITSKDFGADGKKEYTVIKLRSFSDPNYELVYGNYYGMPTVSINDEYVALGNRTAGDIYEFDLGQLDKDLYIWGYQHNFNFENLSYQ